MLRIIAGKYKNMRLIAPVDKTRPTKDMVKEALFSSLGDISDKEVILDVFAGSGAVAIEALSRGVKRAIVNDISKKAIKVIKENIAKVEEEVIIYNLDQSELLKALDEPIDIIFLDPPYEFAKRDELMMAINDKKLLKDDGILIYEVDNKANLNDHYGDLVVYKKRSYGITDLYYFKRCE